MSALFVHTWWMTHRRLKALMRNPGLVVMTLVQPAIWLFLFGGLFRKVAELPGFGAASYADYLVPGVVVMSAVSSNMWAGMGVIDEIERGTLNRFLVSPVRRSAILNAGVIEQAVSTAVQSLVIVFLGRLAGASYPGGVLGVVVLIVASILLGAIFSALSSTMGLLVRQRETIIGLSVFLLLPLTFLSSAFMAEDLMPDWIRNIAAFNPLNWSLDTGRGALADVPDWQAVAVHGGWLLGLAALMILLSTLSFRSYQKSI
ncbi:ABC transporter permease [Planotetraspora phitsanulokensis]|uniref:Transport permease protein n=1 Tax=Planotetraspora phitsanulokensis TaxID=575192 RepID=A0A8J3UMZ1_9ACTN|nr:ABC transporter permease [Planotetraspora phitsanulokensis]GII41655.1 transport permease protein [Planotetraspora phitsanulokensis]